MEPLWNFLGSYENSSTTYSPTDELTLLIHETLLIQLVLLITYLLTYKKGSATVFNRSKTNEILLPKNSDWLFKTVRKRSLYTCCESLNKCN